MDCSSCVIPYYLGFVTLYFLQQLPDCLRNCFHPPVESHEDSKSEASEESVNERINPNNSAVNSNDEDSHINYYYDDQVRSIPIVDDDDEDDDGDGYVKLPYHLDTDDGDGDSSAELPYDLDDDDDDDGDGYAKLPYDLDTDDDDNGDSYVEVPYDLDADDDDDDLSHDVNAAAAAADDDDDDDGIYWQHSITGESFHVFTDGETEEESNEIAKQQDDYNSVPNEPHHVDHQGQVPRQETKIIVVYCDSGDRPAAVKRLVGAYVEDVSEDDQIYFLSAHPNSVYILIPAVGTLKDLVGCCDDDDGVCSSPQFQGFQLRKPSRDHPSPQSLQLMRDIVSEVARLHEQGIILQALKPENILIVKDGPHFRAKLCVKGKSKQVDGDEGSSTSHNNTGVAEDLLNLGYVFFYLMTQGKDPWSERGYEWLLKSVPEAHNLITQLLNPNPEQRPNAIDVLHHPLFWNLRKRLSFLKKASNHLRPKNMPELKLLNALEAGASKIVGSNWLSKLSKSVVNDMKNPRKYTTTSVKDLLRAIRNISEHHLEYSPTSRALLKASDEEIYDYFDCKFPELLIHVYKVFGVHCREDGFKYYFKSSF